MNEFLQRLPVGVLGRDQGGFNFLPPHPLPGSPGCAATWPQFPRQCSPQASGAGLDVRRAQPRPPSRGVGRARGQERVCRARGERDRRASQGRPVAVAPAPRTRTRAAPRPAPPARPARPRSRPGARRRGRRKAGGGGGGRGRGGAGPARRGSARPPVRGSRSAPGPARAAAAALARGLGGTRAPRRSHGPGDPAALADAQRRLLRQQQRGEPGPAEQPPRQAWAASAGRRAPGGEGAAVSERAGPGPAGRRCTTPPGQPDWGVRGALCGTV